MQCPVDETNLESHTIHAIDVDECPQCQGVWFQEGELLRAKDASEPDLIWLDFDLWSDQESFSADWSSRKCPQCGRNMATIDYGSTDVRIDCCIDDHGIWLDKGEFEAIINALENEIHAKDIADYVSASLQEAKEIFSGEQGFVSEWKDFLTVTRLLHYRVLSENPKVAQLLLTLQSSSPFV